MSALKRKRIYPKLYRTALCCVGTVLIVCMSAAKLSVFLSPDVLAQSASGLEIITPSEETGKENTGRIFADSDIVENIPVDLNEKALEEKPQAEQKPTEASDEYNIIPQDFGVNELSVNPCDSTAEYNIQSCANMSYPQALKGAVNTNEPLVLLIHTHATESFAEEGVGTYSKDSSFRSTDASKNMISVGRVMCDVLNSAGVPTIQCETQHDSEDYNTAYNKSLQSTKEYLAKYPSIKYVFDIHRDAIVRDSGEMVKTYCNINGKDCAQIMILVGTNTAGANHPDWQEHFNVALKLQSGLVSKYDSFARAVSLRGASFNQQYAPGSLLFEIGSCANTLNEAKYAAGLLAGQIAETILENS